MLNSALWPTRATSVASTDGANRETMLKVVRRCRSASADDVLEMMHDAQSLSGQSSHIPGGHSATGFITSRFRSEFAAHRMSYCQV